MSDDVVIVGAGWAGLSAAVHLVEHGVRPVILDAAPQVGGRARGIDVELGGHLCRLDNGQHLLIGAYRDTLVLIDKFSRDTPPAAASIVRMPMRLEAVDGLLIKPLPVPAPFDLLGGLLLARGLTWAHRWALLSALGGLRLRGWGVPENHTVNEWLARNRQPQALIKRFWVPLCVATLNTAPEQACAQTFAHVLRDSLGRDASACEFVLPTATLDEVLPGPAAAWLAKRGVSVQLRQAVRSVALEQGRSQGGNLSGNLNGDPSGDPSSDPSGNPEWRIDAGTQSLRARQVILAVPPVNAARLLNAGGHGSEATQIARLDAFDYEPIATVYLAWRAADVQLKPWMMLTEQPATQGFGQWLFDRGEQHGLRIGAVVVSARGRQWLAAEGDGSPIDAITLQVTAQLSLPPPIDARVIVDKRATFRCTPTRPLLKSDVLQRALPGLWLAGDYLWPDYPATLESAVRSGASAAQGCLDARYNA